MIIAFPFKGTTSLAPSIPAIITSNAVTSVATPSGIVSVLKLLNQI